ncbi:hypothetical protein J4207_06225 [Candidatus Woesearchaeota archaeon]|nr:hypothetical protein [Candidatus Woesearchaeota archaeon]
MGRLKKRRTLKKKSSEKKKVVSVITEKKVRLYRPTAVTKFTHRRILPGIIIISAAALLVGIAILFQRYPAAITWATSSIIALFVNTNISLLIGLGVALAILVLVFFLPTKRKKQLVTSQKFKSPKASSSHFGSGWRDFASKHLSESAKSNPEARKLFRKKTKRPFQITIETYQTGLDALYNEIKKRGQVTIEEIEVTFKINKDLAEEWAHILESKQLIQIEYPPFGSMVLTLPKKVEEQ